MKSQTSKLLLAGFSGAGKSTVLRELAALAGSEFTAFTDLDVLVRGDFNTVASFVAKKGWEAFRAEELRQLETVLASPEKTVIALGGGSLENAWPLIKKFPEAKVCHLDCPFAMLWERLGYDTEERPLAKDGQEVMAKLYLKRQPLYQKADFSVKATGTPREVALAILERLRVA